MSQVSDYNIANASGASVRSDLNAVFDAIKTLNSGGTDPSNPEAFMPYVDTADNNNLKIRNSANNGFTTVGPVNSANLGLLPRAGGIMTGQILGDDGSGSGSPAYAFNNDLGTGMFRSGSNTLGFSTGGTERIVVSSAGLTLNDRKELRLNESQSNGSNYVALKSPASVGNNRTFTLPATTGSVGQILSVSSSNHSATNAELEFSTVQGVPIGSVFCIAHTSVPSGYVECNGASLPNGTGTVNGVTANFKPLRDLIGGSLPDLRGEFIRGFDNGRGVDSGRSMLSSQGSQNESHNHSISLSGTTSTKSLTGGIRKISEGFNANGSASGVFTKTQDGTSSITGSSSTSPVGGVNIDASHNHTFSASGTSGSQGGEARPRNIAMMYIIKF